MRSNSIQIRALDGIPEIQPGESLCKEILLSLERGFPASIGSCNQAGPVHPARGAVFVIAQKVVSKAEGRIVELEIITPSAQARDWASQYHKDARMIEVILREAKRIVRMDRGILIVETHHGFICANGGVDASNAPKGTVILLPRDPDASAQRLRVELETALRIPIAVIISDTFGRPWRQGLTNIALGVAGLSPFIDYRGQVDLFGRTLHATVLAVADELAAAAELVMGKTLGMPVALIEGFQHEAADGSGRDLIRPSDEDLFR